MKILNLIFILLFSIVSSQENNILERLTALNNNGKIWYNIDGYSVTKEVLKNAFNEKGLKKTFRNYKISKSETKTKEEKILYNNLFVSTQQKIAEGQYQTNHYYFIENANQTTTVIWFIKNGTTDKETEIELVNEIMGSKIPVHKYFSMDVSSIDFAGRKLELPNRCYWTFLNAIQCPYLGEMNWSIHRTLDSAKEALEKQLDLTRTKKGGIVSSEEFVEIEFEGVPTKAKKVIYDFTGVTSILAGMSGGKYLTIYYVAEKIRDKNISCVMSFWNNDQINPESKLPPLLEMLMKLK